MDCQMANHRERHNSLYGKLGAHEFRLLQLSPCDGPIPIAASLRTVCLDHEPAYIAVSYTWGSALFQDLESSREPQPSQQILCNGVGFPVTENLHSFLTMACSNHSLVFAELWIDAICINQENLDERSSQVQLMARIFGQAYLVAVWLGDGDGESEQSFGLAEAISGLSRRARNRITLETLADERTKAVLGKYSKEFYWKAIARLFTRTYFSRVWVIQEVALARRVVCYCGQASIDWQHLEVVSGFLATTAWSTWLRTCLDSVSGGSSELKLYHGTPNMLRVVRESTAKRNKSALMLNLIRSRLFLSSDPRDKVYALLNIVKGSVSDKPCYVPDYAHKSVVEVYTETAIQMLLDSDDLHLLAHAEGHLFRHFKALPSWVPDWSCPRLTGLRMTGYKRFWAAGDLPRSLDIISHNSRPALKLEGKRLDHVILTGESKQHVIDASSMTGWQAVLNSMPIRYHTGQSRAEVFWRTLLTDTAGRERAEIPASAAYGGGYMKWMQMKLGNSPVNPLFTEGIENSGHVGSVSAMDFQTIYAYSPNLCIFLTSKGFMGLGSESMFPEDEVWIVKGSRAPLILRRQAVGLHELVGGAYVHGLMHGEALDLEGVFEQVTMI
ncbi:heterokaryon incompatibility protein-domain-containing protein, partial [Stachybotrys elegans]